MIELLVLAWILSTMTGAGPKPSGAPPGATPGAPPPFPPPAPATVPIPVPATPPAPTAPAPTPPAAPPASTYTIKSGDTPFLLAKRFTGNGGRWNELLPPNPQLTVVNTRDENGKIIATHVTPFNPGEVLKVPASWPPTPAS